ncbi:MAG: class D beta-lactamase [Ignavibacteriae bacterium]|nr:class D beta-lactamase [Ignavibacteriota bacterium]MCB9206281.1 class D beta-lactamase [Ignavibacteriales bacterium]MCB9209091.1 class D beta-lactamase [Ignavibacteriales bacterium]MCB9217988.1 class D beta-lactamase [Ignavibacteriales bacterium]MCB9260377.1 class D beta-lactamase [Ignavibacteriales bacterium]
MNKIAKILVLIIIQVSSLIAQLNNDKVFIENENWSEFYNSAKVNGTFVLTKLNSDSIFCFNKNRTDSSFLPASTFKIINSLISLETKAIEDENEIIKWDGQKRFLENWNQDQNLRSAIKYSCVWFYQELARRVGKEKMQYYLDVCNYGNSKMGDKIDTFWLEGDIRISAKEQIKFLTNFLNKTLPFSDRNFEIVKNIMLIDSTDKYKYYAKTGWTARVEREIGWYVGFVERLGETWIFAINIDMNGIDDAKYRIEITESILKQEGILN